MVLANRALQNLDRYQKVLRILRMNPSFLEALFWYNIFSHAELVTGFPLTHTLIVLLISKIPTLQVCGNADGVAFIREWLAEWTARIAREQKKKLLTSQPAPKPKAAAKKWQASEESSDWLVSGGASDSDLRDDEDGLANVLLLSGPTGVIFGFCACFSFKFASV